MRVQAQPAPGDPAEQLGQEQRQLLALGGRQVTGELGFVVVDDPTPDVDCVELRIPLWARVLLVLQVAKVQVAYLDPAQVDALVGQEVSGSPEDLVPVFIGQDLHQGAVDIEGNRLNIHRRTLTQKARSRHFA
jgi:hypothetical protein